MNPAGRRETKPATITTFPDRRYGDLIVPESLCKLGGNSGAAGCVRAVYRALQRAVWQDALHRNARHRKCSKKRARCVTQREPGPSPHPHVHQKISIDVQSVCRFHSHERI
ncbi:hypothetical protein [Paraburkholderia sp. SOS3]|uniref:hypothetical protein n=1 Tax=Paraburkholderia sp. SOS3 TaxID=1926494 RepID=UPI0018DBF232|nr:hypothetical protein [Paraburkholderia sp. SOS3]